MKILCWNVAGIRGWAQRLVGSYEATSETFMKKLMKAYTVDFLCLQETKVSSFKDLDKHFVCVEGFDSFWSFLTKSTERKGMSGVCIFSKSGSTCDASAAFHPSFDDEGRCVWIDCGHFILFSVYFPNGGRGKERTEYKLNFYRKFKEYCMELGRNGREIIVCGDVNTAHEGIDIYDPVMFRESSGFNTNERAWITEMLQSGFVDAFRFLHPKKVQYSFWDMRTQKRASNSGWRIDYFLVSKGLVKHIKNCEILDNVMGSDHCPIVLELDLGMHKHFETPKCAGNLRSEYVETKTQKKITQFFVKKDKRVLHNETPNESDKVVKKSKADTKK